MLVYPDKFYCKSCGAYGNLTRLEKKIHGVSRGGVHEDAPRILPKWRKWEAKYGNIMELAVDAHENVRAFSKNVLPFKKRKIDQFVDVGMFGVLEGWMVFPVFDPSHHVVDLVLRAGLAKSHQVKYVVQAITKNEDRPLYVPDWDAVTKADEIYAVYGTIDAWALHSLGYPVVTGTTGKSLDADKLRVLNKVVHIFPDRYEEAEAYKLAHALGWRGNVHLLNWPDENTKDPDDIRMKYGNKILKKLMEKTNGSRWSK